MGEQANRALVKSRERIARLLGAHPKELFFTGSATEALNQALFSAAHWAKTKNKCHILANRMEHPAVKTTLEELQKQGFAVTWVAPDQQGVIPENSLEKYYNDDTGIVVLMAVNNELGTLQPWEKWAQWLEKKECLFICDLVQFLPHFPFSFSKSQVDYAIFAPHKWNGPKGIGILLAKEAKLLISHIYGGAQERGKRAGTENIPSIVGSAKALEILEEQREMRHDNMCELTTLLRNSLEKVEGIRFSTSADNTVPGFVHITVRDCHRDSLLFAFGQEGICVSGGSACSSGALGVSDVIDAIQVPREYRDGAIRISFGWDNTKEEVLQFCDVFRSVLSRLRSL